MVGYLWPGIAIIRQSPKKQSTTLQYRRRLKHIIKTNTITNNLQNVFLNVNLKFYLLYLNLKMSMNYGVHRGRGLLRTCRLDRATLIGARDTITTIKLVASQRYLYVFLQNTERVEVRQFMTWIYEIAQPKVEI